jgi:hypothetical protein
MTAEAEHGQPREELPHPQNHKPHMKLRSTASTLAPSRPDFLNSLSQWRPFEIIAIYLEPGDSAPAAGARPPRAVLVLAALRTLQPLPCDHERRRVGVRGRRLGNVGLAYRLSMEECGPRPCDDERWSSSDPCHRARRKLARFRGVRASLRGRRRSVSACRRLSGRKPAGRRPLARVGQNLGAVRKATAG